MSRNERPTNPTRLDWLRGRVEQVSQQPAVQPLRPSERARLHRLEAELSIANAENEHLRTRLADARALLELRGNAVLELRVRIQQEVERCQVIEKELAELKGHCSTYLGYTRRVESSFDDLKSFLTEERRISAHLRTQLATAMAEPKQLRESAGPGRDLRIGHCETTAPTQLNKRLKRHLNLQVKAVFYTCGTNTIAWVERDINQIGLRLSINGIGRLGLVFYRGDEGMIEAAILRHLRADLDMDATFCPTSPLLADLLKEI